MLFNKFFLSNTDIYTSPIPNFCKRCVTGSEKLPEIAITLNPFLIAICKPSPSLIFILLACNPPSNKSTVLSVSTPSISKINVVIFLNSARTFYEILDSDCEIDSSTNLNSKIPNPKLLYKLIFTYSRLGYFLSSPHIFFSGVGIFPIQ